MADRSFIGTDYTASISVTIIEDEERGGAGGGGPLRFLFLFLPRLLHSAAGLFKIPLTDRRSRISIPPCRPMILKAIVTGLSPSSLAGGFPLRWMVNILIEWTLDPSDDDPSSLFKII